MDARTLLLPALLLGLLACGGGGGGGTTTTAATALAYTDPTTGAYLLKQNTTLSTSTHLVLELWGPASASASGVTVSFTLAGTAAAWHNVSSTDATATYVANGTVFDLGSGTAILKARLSGSTLTATVAEKGTGSPKTLDKALLRLALDMPGGLTSGATATLTPNASGCRILLADGTLSAITVTASTITAR